MFWLIPIILVGGTIAYVASKKDNETTKKTPRKKYEFKKSELPSKIRFWDDIKGAKKSGKWKSGTMPSEFRHYEKFNDKTWERISYWEFRDIESWDMREIKTPKGNYYISHYHYKKGKKSGKEGIYYISYFSEKLKEY